MVERVYNPKKSPSDAFVFPKERKYPIFDESRARDALARVAKDGTPNEKKAVVTAVKRRYPNIQIPSNLVRQVRRGQ